MPVLTDTPDKIGLKSTWLLLLAKATGSLVLFGSVLSFVDLNKPWTVELSLQVLITAVVVGLVAFAVGLYSKQQLHCDLEKEFYLKQLSAREQEVAALLISDLSNKEICRRLFIEPNTLKTHIRHIYRKTYCSSRENFIERFK